LDAEQLERQTESLLSSIDLNLVPPASEPDRAEVAALGQAPQR
jgi:hypothetical protein